MIFNSYVSLPEGKLEVPTTSKGLFFRPNFQRVSPQNMAKNMVLTYLHFRIHDNPHELVRYIYHKPCFCSAIYVWQLSKRAGLAVLSCWFLFWLVVWNNVFWAILSVVNQENETSHGQVSWNVNPNMFYDFPFSWECHFIPTDFHSIIFQRGRVETTNQSWLKTVSQQKWVSS